MNANGNTVAPQILARIRLVCLDLPEVALLRTELGDLIRDSYRVLAPKRLIERMAE